MPIWQKYESFIFAGGLTQKTKNFLFERGDASLDVVSARMMSYFPFQDMQQDAIDCATQALEKYNIEKDIAAFIKKEFDKKYNPVGCWSWR